MNEKKYEKKIEIQQKMISHQSKRINDLELQVKNLKSEIEKKDKIINSVTPLKEEFMQHIAEITNYKEEYKKLISELRKMKEIINQEAYKGKWWLIKFLIR